MVAKQRYLHLRKPVLQVVDAVVDCRCAGGLSLDHHQIGPSKLDLPAILVPGPPFRDSIQPNSFVTTLLQEGRSQGRQYRKDHGRVVADKLVQQTDDARSAALPGRKDLVLAVL